MMRWQTEEPKRPYKNFYDFCQHACWYGGYGSAEWYKEHPGEFPCLQCRGYGKEHHIEDHDPIEGYKMASMYACTSCKGTGTCSLKKFKAAYRKEIEDYQKRLREYRIDMKNKKSGLSKLTAAEKKALGVET